MSSIAKKRQDLLNEQLDFLDHQFETRHAFYCIAISDTNAPCKKTVGLKKRSVNHKAFIEAAKNPDLDREAWAKVFAPKWCCSSHPPSPEKPRDEIFEFVIPIMVEYQKRFPAELSGSQFHHDQLHEDKQAASMPGDRDTLAVSTAPRKNAGPEQKTDLMEPASNQDTLSLDAHLEAKLHLHLDIALRARDVETEQKIAAIKAAFDKQLSDRDSDTNKKLRVLKKANQTLSVELQSFKDAESARAEVVSRTLNINEQEFQWVAEQIRSVEDAASTRETKRLVDMAILENSRARHEEGIVTLRNEVQSIKGAAPVEDDSLPNVTAGLERESVLLNDQGFLLDRSLASRDDFDDIE